MRWSKIFNEVDDGKLTLAEFITQALLIGGTLIGAFWLAGLFS